MEDILKQIENDIYTLNGLELKERILDYHPYDIAKVLRELDLEYIKKVFDLIDANVAADILEYYDEDEAADILELMDTNMSSKIISKMELDDAVDVVNELEDDVKKEVINKIDDEVKEDIINLAKYDESMAASIMTDNFMEIDVNMEVKDAMQKLVKESYEQEVIDTLFVTDNDILVGTIDLKTLIVARKNELIKDIMDGNFKSVNLDTDIRDAIDMIKEYNLLALPVLDNGKLEGIITIDDAIDVVDEENKDDYDKMAGITGDNSISFKTVIKSRILWLVILLFLSFLVSSVMDGFKNIIMSITPLVFFQSLVLDMGGNAGTQSLATSVIEISQGKLDKAKDVFIHLFKELKAGMLTSVLLGVISFVLALAFTYARGIEGVNPFLLSLVIGLSMMVAIVISNFLGSLVPIILYKLHIDPAVASGPFISTLNDIVSVSVYYILAYLILIAGGIM